MPLLFRRASFASLGLALGLSAFALSPLAAEEAKPAAPADAAAAAGNDLKRRSAVRRSRGRAPTCPSNAR